MLVIRFQRTGKKHQPSYRIVVAERRSSLGGPSVETLGSYEVATKKVIINKERVLHWLKMGAQASDTVWNLFVREKVIDGPKRKLNIKFVEKENAKSPDPVAQVAEPKKEEESVSPVDQAPVASKEEVPASVETSDEVPAETPATQ
ncbi:MAG: 30S ribosomal protein S16 [Patescibacteria group bacterium]|nr:30S ribosomal protein S16 [Patescibacteria group bacterium]